MQTENRLFDDLARVASGALSTLGGLRDEIEARVKERVERFANEMDLVTRDEFEAVRALAARAREEQERLEVRVVALEQALREANVAAAGAVRAAPKRRGRADTDSPEPHTPEAE